MTPAGAIKEKTAIIIGLTRAVLYYIQSMLSLHGIEDENQRETMKKTALVSPIMIAVFSLMAPAGVTLYWVVGGFVQIIQQFVINYLIRPKLRKQVAEEYKNNPPKAPASNGRRVKKDITPTNPTNANRSLPTNGNKKRNAGKQRNRN